MSERLTWRQKAGLEPMPCLCPCCDAREAETDDRPPHSEDRKAKP